MARYGSVAIACNELPLRQRSCVDIGSHTHKLNMTPYGPAGIAFSPNAFNKIIAAKLSSVETIDEMSMKA